MDNPDRFADFRVVRDTLRAEKKARRHAEPTPNGQAPPPPDLRVFNPADWENDPEPEDRKWIVPDYILDETVALLSADGGTGKSYLKLQLAAARALEREWIGLLPEPGRTLVLSCEDDIKEMKRRLYGILKFYKSEARPDGATGPTSETISAWSISLAKILS